MVLAGFITYNNTRNKAINKSQTGIAKPRCFLTYQGTFYLVTP